MPITDATLWLRVVTTTMLPEPPIEYSSGLSSAHFCSSSFHTSSRISIYLFLPISSCRQPRNSSILSGSSHFFLVASSIMDLTRSLTLNLSDTQSHNFNSKCFWILPSLYTIFARVVLPNPAIPTMRDLKVTSPPPPCQPFSHRSHPLGHQV